MAKRKTREEDIEGSQDPESDYDKPLTRENQDEYQSAPLPDATQNPEKKEDKRGIGEDKGDAPDEDNPSEAGLQNVPRVVQVSTQNIPGQFSTSFEVLTWFCCHIR